MDLCSCEDCIQKIKMYCNTKKLCYKCKRKLVPIGDARENGAGHKDWNTRHYHKKCWKEMNDDCDDESYVLIEVSNPKLKDLIGTCDIKKDNEPIKTTISSEQLLDILKQDKIKYKNDNTCAICLNSCVSRTSCGDRYQGLIGGFREMIFGVKLSKEAANIRVIYVCDKCDNDMRGQTVIRFTDSSYVVDCWCREND